MTPVTSTENPNELLKTLAGTDNKIIDKKEFKNAEKVFDDNYDEFMKGSGNDILALFDDAQLQTKIDDVVKKGINKTAERLNDGDRAYLVLKALKEGKTGDYAALLKAELGKLTLENKKIEFTKLISKDKDLSDIEKQVLYDQLNEEFTKASTSRDPVGELEEHFGIALNTIKGTKQIIESLLSIFNPETYTKPIEDFANICYKKGVEVKLIVENTYNRVKEKSQANYDEMLDWIESTGKMTAEMAINLMKWEYIQRNNFGNWCSDNRATMETVFKNTANTLLENGVLAWNIFAEGCISTRDMTQDFFIEATNKWMEREKQTNETFVIAWDELSKFCTSNRDKMQTFYETTTKFLIETGVLAWNVFADFCANNREKTQTFFESTTKTFFESIENDKEKLRANRNIFAEFCTSNRDKMQTFYETTTKFLIETGVLAWNIFADFCANNREKTQTFFESTIINLIQNGTLARDVFTTWCGDKREKVQVTVGKIGKGLYEAGNITLDVLFQGLILHIGTIISVGKFIIDVFAYTGEKLVVLGQALGEIIYKTGKNIGETFTFIFETVYKSGKNAFISSLDRLEKIVGDVKTVFNTLLTLGKLKLNDGLNWLSLKYKNFVSMRKEIGERSTVKIEEFTKRVGDSRKLANEKTLEFGIKMASFVQYLIDQGIYGIEQIGKFFVRTGEKIATFFKDLMKTGGVILNTIVEWFTITYKSIELAANKLLELGIGAWDKVGEIMYHAGITVEIIAKAIYKYLDVAADKVCDFFLGLYNGAVDKIDEIVDIVAGAVKEKVIQVKDRAYIQYKKTMDTGKAALKAVEAAKERLGTKVDEIGNRLLKKGVSALDITKALYKNFTDFADEVGIFINNQIDNSLEAVSSTFRDASAWLSNATEQK